ncbi:hypothetical protein [Saccharospirillum salsuginis]|uniref:Uncharacterized protein n=1 Tax=Saccharospirillum salsuginis TaxID=418750 RepID=A0A918KEV0_9GAMM|nr:hypothetical protein [Saccharospirillum salsuginis]GGX60630.1 hypothetical protein GCM10007392_30820 [Saccharospirillum salsuginis]
MKKVDRYLQAGLKAREMRKSLGYSYLAAEEIIRSMRALREALPKPDAKSKSLPSPPLEDPDS